MLLNGTIRYEHKCRWSGWRAISSQVNLQFISAEPGKKKKIWLGDIKARRKVIRRIWGKTILSKRIQLCYKGSQRPWNNTGIGYETWNNLWGERLIWNLKLASEVLSMKNISASVFHIKKFEVKPFYPLSVQDETEFLVSGLPVVLNALRKTKQPDFSMLYCDLWDNKLAWEFQAFTVLQNVPGPIFICWPRRKAYEISLDSPYKSCIHKPPSHWPWPCTIDHPTSQLGVLGQFMRKSEAIKAKT